MKLKIEIKNRWTGKVIFEFETENNTVAKTINEYVRQTKEREGLYAHANLSCADLTRANLTDANLSCADLTRANLTRANLTRANLTDANLSCANLTDANLTRANLTRANLTDANLSCANLTDANLTRANLTDANLTDANLTRANLSCANLTRANLTRANLTDANLTRANLTRANLSCANLTRANLTRANLSCANLTRANLTRANLTDANLLMFKADIWRVLLMYKSEVSGLKKAIIDGKINGSVYSGECACLKGMIANVAGCEIDLLPNVVKDSSEPAEQWFLQFKEGQTPENSNTMKTTLEWIEEFEHYLKA